MSATTDAGREKLLREKELTFFGAVTAAISHELNNAIATIEQTAGLLEDLIGSGGTDPIPNEQLQKIADRISKQTKRGATIVRRLNAFAHSVDDSEKELDLNTVMDHVAQLAHRIADRRRVQLETEPSGRPVTVSTSPFRVQQAVYLSIQEAVSVTREGGAIGLSTGTRDAKAWIAVESRFADSSEPIDFGYLETLMGQLNGELLVTSEENRLAIRLVLLRK